MNDLTGDEWLDQVRRSHRARHSPAASNRPDPARANATIDDADAYALLIEAACRHATNERLAAAAAPVGVAHPPGLRSRPAPSFRPSARLGPG